MCVHLRQQCASCNKGSSPVAYSTKQSQDAPSATMISQPLEVLGDTEDGQRRGAPLLPWSLLGVGVLVAWLCCTHLPGVFLLFEGMSAGAVKMTVDYGMRVGDIGFFLMYAALLRRFGPISSHPRLCCGLIAFSSVGTFVVTLFLAASSPSSLIFFGRAQHAHGSRRRGALPALG